MSIQDVEQQQAELLGDCHRLLADVAEAPYGLSLLSKVRAMLEACLEYKANRSRRYPGHRRATGAQR